MAIKKIKVTKKVEEKKTSNVKEMMKKLPKGSVIKQITIGPEQIVKWIVYALIFGYVLSVVAQYFSNTNIVPSTYSEMVSAIKDNKAKEIIVREKEVVVELNSENKILIASKEPNVSFIEYLQKEGMDTSKLPITVNTFDLWSSAFNMLMAVGTIASIFFVFWFLRKGMGGGGGMGGPFGFGKSTAKLFVKGKQKTTFADVAGVDEAKKDLEEVVDFLKFPDKYLKLGARVPKGVLLVGPAGVGKTLLAKAVAGEANVTFFSMAGSEFMEMLVGVGASRVRDLFATAKKAGKAIIFIDEIDAIGRARGGMEGGHGEREQTLNQILVEMDGFEPNTSVVVLAATNRGDLLDPALKRPGRFDRTVELEYPDLEARGAILAIHAKNKPFEKDINWPTFAKRTVGFSGADLENMLNEAAIGAAREGQTVIKSADIDEAMLKVRIGPARKRTQTDQDKLITAYHEAGHAIVNYAKCLDPVHKITIVSRGHALGFTFIPPERDRTNETKTRLVGQMAMALGGRAAEQIVFGEITTGAASDIAHVTSIARNMVTEWGMSNLGPVKLDPQYDMADYGKGIFEPSRISEGMQAKVDVEISRLVETALAEAVEILKDNKIKLDKLARILVDKETVDEEEFSEMMKK